jgi:hypothetical protein
MSITAKAIDLTGSNPDEEATALQAALVDAVPPHSHLVGLVRARNGEAVLAVFDHGDAGSSAFENLSPK